MLIYKNELRPQEVVGLHKSDIDFNWSYGFINKALSHSKKDYYWMNGITENANRSFLISKPLLLFLDKYLQDFKEYD
ncbi:hypothetical protein AZF37_08030 [endosymbiont 'TC1' of Trimyema compressum]|nr:hypothetical protein AZF37_08030 [endosymbiont 'TC1' of Trimyema compressum]